MKGHPYADILPLLEGQAFDSLVADIRANGLLEPITIYEGQILGGRSRYRACEAAGIKPQFLEFDGDDPLGFVLSLNLQRRHLSEAQRAMVAARSPPWAGRRKIRRATEYLAARGGEAPERLRPQPPAPRDPRSRHPRTGPRRTRGSKSLSRSPRSWPTSE